MGRPRLAACAVVTAACIFASDSQPAARAASPVSGLEAESAGWDGVVNGLLSVFDRADVLMLGEAHGRKVDAELRLRLVRHADFPKKVRFLVAEVIDPSQQAMLDRYIRGDDGADADVQSWRIGQFLELFTAIRDINRGLAPDERVRVLAGREEGGPNGAIAQLREQVIRKKQKALVVYGAGHVWKSRGNMTKAVERLIPGSVFVAETLTALIPRASGTKPPEYVALDNAMKAFDATLQSHDRPVLVFLRRKPAAARLAADPFYLGQGLLGPKVTLGDNDDAVVYFGLGAEAGR
jgi:hypothetical protein